MANVDHWSTSWVSTEGNDMLPGEAHDWWAVGFHEFASISVTAYPIIGAPEERILEVDNVRVQGTSDGWTLLFTVRNVGSGSEVGYIVEFGEIYD